MAHNLLNPPSGKGVSIVGSAGRERKLVAFKGDESKFSLATTVTLALAVAAVVFVKVPLKSSRPSGNGTDLNGTTGELKAHARLWEDPFAVVQRDLEARKQKGLLFTGEGTVNLSGAGRAPTPSLTGDVKITTLIKETEGNGQDILKQKITALAEHGEQVTALVVMTRGGSSVDDSESRIRDRFAVEAALEVGCFKPEKTQFLSYFIGRSNGASGPRSFATPYEWYRRSTIAVCGTPGEQAGEEHDQQILVLWVAADEWGESILQHIDKLLELFRPPNVTPAVAANVTAKLIGPRSSSEFRGVLKEIQHRGRTKKERDGKNTEPFSWQRENRPLALYSPWATAMPGLLAYGLKRPAEGTGGECHSYAACNDTFHRLLSDAGLALNYRIGSDHTLFESLFEELRRRKMTVGKDAIVLIGEWDSFYARALPLTFSAAACRFSGQCATTEQGVDKLKKGEISLQALNIRQYSYLSGLDGEVPEDRSSKSTPKNEDREKERGEGGKATLRDISSYEKPEGPSQLDYVRRLVTRIKSEEQGRKIKAIGILGTDPYDALLILQAVRKQFPTVLFFATDLDARYFHENEQKWTRNVLIVSHFGLQLAPEYQQAIPPFRTSYQTSAFLAVLHAIGHIAPTEEMVYRLAISPRLFEIGRHGAVDLSVDRSNGDTKSLHPSRNDVGADHQTLEFPSRIGFLWIVLVVVVFLAVWSHGRSWNWLAARDELDGRTRRFKRWFRSAIVASPVLVVLLLWCKIRHFNYAEDEPFSWFDGVSVWPTELFRLFAALLCLAFLIKARADLVDNTDDLTGRFFPAYGSTPMRAQGLRRSLEGFWRNLDWIFHGPRSGDPGTAVELWARYAQAHAWPQRVARIALWILVYLLIIVPMWMFMNDGEWRLFVPCRGEFSCEADVYLTRASVALLIALNVAVLDAIVLCARWIRDTSSSSGLSELATVRLIVARTRIVNRRTLYPFLVLFIVVGARSHYFDNWDFPPALIVALMVNSLVALASACLLYLAAVGAKGRALASIQGQLDLALTQRRHPDAQPVGDASSERLRQIIGEIDAVQQGAFVPFYQQPVVQATLVAALAFLQYWYLGQ